MATVLLLRHGRSTSNAAGTLAGDQPVELDSTGQDQARAVGARLAMLPLAAVVTSPLVRCRQTVELALPGVAATVDERLSECGYGEWTGRSLKSLAKEPLWRVVQAHPSGVTFPGGESMAAMAARVVAAVRAWDARVTAEHGPHALWLACSHGDPIATVAADALGLHLDQFQRIRVDPGSLTVIHYSPARPFVVHLNDVGGDLARLVPPKPRGRRRGSVRGGAGAGRRSGTASSDAPVGGGAG